MTVKIDGTNTVANPAFTGADTDTGLQCGTNELKLVTGGTARATVDSSGNLGVGTTSPESNRRLTVDIGTSSVNVAVFKSQDTSGGSYIGFMDKDTTNGNRVRVGAINDDMAFITAGSERLRILSDGTIRLASGCPGIDFSQIQTNASGMTSETLDSYEEGTWTPAIKFGGGSTGITYSSYNRGWYTKIGRVVTLKMALEVTNKGTSTGNASIVVPFNSSLTSSSHAQAIPHSKVNANMVFAYGTAGSGEFGLRHSVASTSTGFGYLNNGDFGTGFSLVGSITYMI